MHIQALIMHKQGINICFSEVDYIHSSPRNTSFLGEEHLSYSPTKRLFLGEEAYLSRNRGGFRAISLLKPLINLITNSYISTENLSIYFPFTSKQLKEDSFFPKDYLLSISLM